MYQLMHIYDTDAFAINPALDLPYISRNPSDCYFIYEWQNLSATLSQSSGVDLSPLMCEDDMMITLR